MSSSWVDPGFRWFAVFTRYIRFVMDDYVANLVTGRTNTSLGGICRTV